MVDLSGIEDEPKNLLFLLYFVVYDDLIIIVEALFEGVLVVLKLQIWNDGEWPRDVKSVGCLL